MVDVVIAVKPNHVHFSSTFYFFLFSLFLMHNPNINSNMQDLVAFKFRLTQTTANPSWALTQKPEIGEHYMTTITQVDVRTMIEGADLDDIPFEISFTAYNVWGTFLDIPYHLKKK